MSRNLFAWRRLLDVLLVGLLLPVLAQAHTVRPAVATLELDGQSAYTLNIRVNAEMLLAGVSPQHQDTDQSPLAAQYDALRALGPTELQARFDEFLPQFLAALTLQFDGVATRPEFVAVDVPEIGNLAVARDSLIRLRGVIPTDARTVSWGWPAGYGSSVIRVVHPGAEPAAIWLQAGAVSEALSLGPQQAPRSRFAIIKDYGELGFLHILPLGLDHILFVLGIFLLSLHIRPILWQVSAFTVAHTLTLGLSMYGLIALPASVVEPLIAASIVYVGVENIWHTQLSPWRIVLVFMFGLLHGLGFAGVLGEIGMPAGEFLTALISFNIGVEFGQLAVVSAAFLLIGQFRNRSWYRQRVVIPASALIALTGAYWTIQRLL